MNSSNSHSRLREMACISCQVRAESPTGASSTACQNASCSSSSKWLRPINALITQTGPSCRVSHSASDHPYIRELCAAEVLRATNFRSAMTPEHVRKRDRSPLVQMAAGQLTVVVSMPRYALNTSQQPGALDAEHHGVGLDEASAQTSAVAGVTRAGDNARPTGARPVRPRSYAEPTREAHR